MKKLLQLLPVIFLLLFTACTGNRLDIDVSGVELKDLEIQRMEQDMFEMHPDSIAQHTPRLISKYGTFYLSFINEFINRGGINDSMYAIKLKDFLSDKEMRGVYGDVKKKYHDISHIQAGLTDALKHFRYYFPEKNTPEVVTMMSGFNYSMMRVDSTVGIGLEMYLGPDNRFYKMLSPEVFPAYKKRNMSEAYIVPDFIKAWLTITFEKEINTDFLSQIVHAGKIMYLMDAMLPDTHDTLKIGYTEKQLEWCEDNEFNIWAFFIEKKILYTTDFTEVIKYTNEGPFTPGFDKASPARTGHWIGWQIVRAYMNKNQDVTLKQLLEEEEAQKILTQSKYKPGK